MIRKILFIILIGAVILFLWKIFDGDIGAALTTLWDVFYSVIDSVSDAFIKAWRDVRGSQ